tara:strand:- start:1007 stop:2890 length:1884 start_codon:yes stop_codon:yes gene_type:complete
MRQKNKEFIFHKYDADQLINRRAALLTLGKGSIFAILVSRLAYLQIIENDSYSSLSDDNRITHRLLEPERGFIFDISGRPIATNKENYQAAIILEETVSINAALNAFNHVLPNAKLNIPKTVKKIKKSKKFVPIKLIEDLSWEDFAKLNSNIHNLKGVYPVVGFKRHYPKSESHAHLVGYVSAIDEKEVYNNPFAKLNNAKSGKIGIEKSFDESLRGILGNKSIEINAEGREIREIRRVESKKGENVQLTIDSELQDFCYKQLEGVSGSISVTNVKTGEYLALVSSPSYDPNLFSIGIGKKKWSELITDKFKPLINKTISNNYPPGSTIKPLVAIAALENGINPNEELYCNGQHEIEDKSLESGVKIFHCWKKKGHGNVNMSEAIKVSCDVYFYQIARKIGINKIAEVCNRFGLGKEVFDIFYEETKGVVPNKTWKKENLGEKWMVGETLSAGIGQGYFLTSSAQLSLVLAQIVNGGKKLDPSIIVHQNDNNSKIKYDGRIIANLNHLEIVKRSLIDSTNTVGGTSYRSRIIGDLKMGGKTGTSQVRVISKKEREEGIIKNKDLPWEERDHGLFIGYGPIDNPLYALSIIIEHGGSGSGAAAPLAKEIFEYIFKNKMNINRKKIINV